MDGFGQRINLLPQFPGKSFGPRRLNRRVGIPHAEVQHVAQFPGIGNIPADQGGVESELARLGKNRRVPDPTRGFTRVREGDDQIASIVVSHLQDAPPRISEGMDMMVKSAGAVALVADTDSCRSRSKLGN